MDVYSVKCFPEHRRGIARGYSHNPTVMGLQELKLCASTAYRAPESIPQLLLNLARVARSHFM